ncbi:MAG: hypothetical protein ABW195_14495 [Ilumatobacteraceae bacterium]
MPRRTARRSLLVLVALVPLACGDDSDSSSGSTGSSGASGSSAASDDGTAEATPVGTAVTSDRCLVRLHGKGGAGAATVDADGVAVIAPTGNADGWGARQWLYFPDAEYDAARQIVEDAIVGCQHVIVDGFSNGAAFAAKLYCRGETFDGRLVRVVVDDPVVDDAVSGCSPSPDVDLTLYWTGALEDTAQAGWDCAESDWTCEGGSTIGIDAYAAALGVDPQDSPNDDHAWYVDAPELSQW